MSTEQPEALRYAEELDCLQYADYLNHHEAAAELRRLHEDCEDWKKGYALLFKENANRRRLNEELVEALRKCSEQLTRLGYSANHADQALAKAETP
jgi:Holliday junction resolvasome RuvABC DNA-binding subunit